MPDFESLRRELATARLRLIGALRLDKRLTRLCAADSLREIPATVMESRRWVKDRSAKYVAALSRYRVALEKAIAPLLESAGPSPGAGRRSPRRRYLPKVPRPPVRARSFLPRRTPR
jgi:hypothetical protein